MLTLMGPQLACRFVLILSLQWAFKNLPVMVLHFSHLEMEKLHQVWNTVQCSTGPFLQAHPQPSYWQQAPLFPPCPSESLFLLTSIKACCCLLCLYSCCKVPFDRSVQLLPSLAVPVLPHSPQGKDSCLRHIFCFGFKQLIIHADQSKLNMIGLFSVED